MASYFYEGNIKADVEAKLKTLGGNVTTEVMHNLYMGAIRNELKRVKGDLTNLLRIIEDKRAEHPEQGWIMVTKEQRSACRTALYRVMTMFEVMS